MENKQIWFITGASKGLGLSLVKSLLNAGHAVAATSRKLVELVAAAGVDDNFLPLQADVKDEAAIASAIKSTVEKFGRIDVVVNNAGYGIGGSIEELSHDETRVSFDVNVFGTLNVIRQAMPYLRAQRSGHIINISSIAGITANTGWAIYAATKYAIVGLTESLATDIKEFGIKATVVAPGGFRTNFLEPDSLYITNNTIDAYTAVRETHTRYLKMSGAQAGDPDKAATAMMELVNLENPPLYLLLGSDAYARANEKLERLNTAFKQYESLTKSTDY
ncbi:SDR family NAD(P)-dependent oxidoreductase [Mucilaginibacter sp. UR6-1]|uniref:SDR family NAD(P)-dependent oxidoreductase n=1 Tax=Mucilaginibacter sp. UR6-1 TaxID=1435643 RepID=UPI001E51AD42|nr:SDR family NAD(P)-dependent oxidoreductase [Mucilaginibacter sp. UR6-1]MCC8410139.1 SDR family NAD(P)-dependent oxidoreductase [Mucilaginibacter sp. UR6-1]